MVNSMKMVDVKYGLWLKVMRYANCMEGIVYGTGSPIVTSQTGIIVKKNSKKKTFIPSPSVTLSNLAENS